ECGYPQWIFGLSRYAFLSDGRIACVYASKGLDNLGIIEPGSTTVKPLDVPYDTFADIRSDGAHRLYFIGASASIAPEIVRLDLRDGHPHVLRRSMHVDLDVEDISTPEPIEFPTERRLSAFALYYAPKNKHYAGSSGERAPLLVVSHGGPTAASNSALKLGIQ